MSDDRWRREAAATIPRPASSADRCSLTTAADDAGDIAST